MTVNIRRKLRGSPLQNHLDIVYNRIKVFDQRIINQIGGQFSLYRQSGYNIPSVNHRALPFFFKVAERHFDIFRRLSADDQAELPSHRRPDGVVKFLSAHLDQTAQHNAAQGKNGNFRGVKAHVDNQNALRVFHVNLKSKAVSHCLFHHHDLFRLHTRIPDQVIKGPLFHSRHIRGNRNIIIGGLEIFAHIADKIFDQKLHISDVRNDAVRKRIGNMNIPRRFLIHFKGRIPIGKERILILNGNHIFFNHHGIIRTVINFNITGSQINTKCIIRQDKYPFLIISLPPSNLCNIDPPKSHDPLKECPSVLRLLLSYE